jgi:phosphate transport system substrate-binding protein
MNEAVAAAHRRKGIRIALTDPESNEAVSRTAGGIGTAALDGVLVTGLPVNVVALNGVKPERKTLADGTYPLANGDRLRNGRYTFRFRRTIPGIRLLGEKDAPLPRNTESLFRCRK